MTDLEKAKLLISSVSKALADGVKHYSIEGQPLTTTKAVLEALTRDGQIRLEDAPRDRN